MGASQTSLDQVGKRLARRGRRVHEEAHLSQLPAGRRNALAAAEKSCGHAKGRHGGEEEETKRRPQKKSKSADNRQRRACQIGKQVDNGRPKSISSRRIEPSRSELVASRELVGSRESTIDLPAELIGNNGNHNVTSAYKSPSETIGDFMAGNNGEQQQRHLSNNSISTRFEGGLPSIESARVSTTNSCQAAAAETLRPPKRSKIQLLKANMMMMMLYQRHKRAAQAKRATGSVGRQTNDDEDYGSRMEETLAPVSSLPHNVQLAEDQCQRIRNWLNSQPSLFEETLELDENSPASVTKELVQVS